MASLKRPALGQIASLGSLYNARTDSFVGLSLLKGPPPKEAITEIDAHSSNIQFEKSETNRQKLTNMNISAELSASFLCGLVQVEGSGSYLNNTRDSRKTMESSLLYNITTKNEILNFSYFSIRDQFAMNELSTSLATHVVAEILWGANSIITFRGTVSEKSDETKIEGQFKALFEKLKVIKVNGSANVDIGGSEEDGESQVQFTVLGDILADDGTIPMDFASACKFISEVPSMVKKANGGKGRALIYTLLPIENLIYFGTGFQIIADVQYRALGSESLERFVDLFDDIQNVERTLSDYLSVISTHSVYVPAEHRKHVIENRNKVRERQASLKTEYAELLRTIREGQDRAVELTELYKKFHEGDDAIENLAAVATEYADKIDFIKIMVEKGARYVGNSVSSMDRELASNQYKDAYALYFTEFTRKRSENWRDIFALLLRLLQDESSRSIVLLVDEEGLLSPHSKPTIVQYRGGKMIAEDVFEERKLLEENCLMRYKPEDLERGMMQRPIARGVVKIPCPGVECSQTRALEWICQSCLAPAQYGLEDCYVYCDCGRVLYSAFEFHCNDPKHGPAFQKYDNELLKKKLRALESFPELNILLLGETGVGKSTFINAFSNYLYYETLQDALQAESLDYLIPCSFSIQSVDKTHGDDRLIQHDIEIGQSEDEHNSKKGESATQKTTVYPFHLDDVTVRLIDTPGIGDTRGLDKDTENMENILNILRNFNKIHGIIILLKPNDSRLTVVFRFCIQQLLTHLHRDAIKNMVFGFTNTRASYYQPGDTFTPLNNLLKEYEDPEEYAYLKSLKQLLKEHESSEGDKKDKDLQILRNLLREFESSKGYRGFKPLEDYLNEYEGSGEFKDLRTLQNLLLEYETAGEYKDLNLGLFKTTVYCFDSESFRYLAAQKRGIDMGNENDYANSWKHSREESLRLLEHFQRLEPHPIKNTLSLNDTRRRVGLLTKPIVELVETIKHSIEVNKSDIEALAKKEATKCTLEQLRVKKKMLTAVLLNQPRTVCKNIDCVEFREVGDEKNEIMIVYKTWCHNPCYLENGVVFAIDTPGLKSCDAFLGKNSCRNCKHRWQEHLHVSYELHEEVVPIHNEVLEKELEAAESDIQRDEIRIQAKKKAIEDFQSEYREMQDAAVDFSIFLKKNSITPYNDAMLGYLDVLIKTEEDRVQVGGSPDPLDRLRQSKAEYKELIEILERNMKEGMDKTPLGPEEVDARFKKLFALKHYGEMLEKRYNVSNTEQSNMFRERPHVLPPSRKKGWSLSSLKV